MSIALAWCDFKRYCEETLAIALNANNSNDKLNVVAIGY